LFEEVTQAPEAGRAPELLMRLGLTLQEDDAYERAMIRSFERGAGATQAGDQFAADARLRELDDLVSKVRTALGSAAGQSNDLAASLDIPDADVVSTNGRGSTLIELLPDDVLAILYRGGLAADELRRGTVGVVAPGAATRVIRELTTSSGALSDFADGLGLWEPRRDLLKVAQEAGEVVFEIRAERPGTFRWAVLARDGRTIATSADAFVSEGAARRAVDVLRRELESAPIRLSKDLEPDA
jgi:uncharacterized protein YegP (UPF0339 family)